MITAMRRCQNGLQSEIDQTSNLAEDATTFTNWADMSYQFMSRCGLKNYNKISKAELSHLLKSRRLFAASLFAAAVLCTAAFIWNQFGAWEVGRQNGLRLR